MFLRPRLAFSAEDNLYLVVFFKSYYRFMNTFIPITATQRIFKLAVIKRHCKHAISGAAAERLALRRFKFPVIVGNPPNLYRRMMSAQRKVKDFSHEIKSLRVFYNALVSFLGVRVV